MFTFSNRSLSGFCSTTVRSTSVEHFISDLISILNWILLWAKTSEILIYHHVLMFRVRLNKRAFIKWMRYSFERRGKQENILRALVLYNFFIRIQCEVSASFIWRLCSHNVWSMCVILVSLHCMICLHFTVILQLSAFGFLHLSEWGKKERNKNNKQDNNNDDATLSNIETSWYSQACTIQF